MFDYDDDLPEIETSLLEELRAGRDMVRCLVSAGLKVGIAVGIASIVIASTADKIRGNR